MRSKNDRSPAPGTNLDFPSIPADIIKHAGLLLSHHSRFPNLSRCTMAGPTVPALNRFRTLLIIALAAGLLIGWIDTNPGWDDTGITVGLILLSSASLGAIMPSRAWVWGLAVGCGIPLFNLLRHGNPAALVSIVFAFAGAYAGTLARKAAGPAK